MTEYCPSFDTEVLRLTYKAMGYVHCSLLVASVLKTDSRRRRMPEPLLWYIFYALANGLKHIEQGLFEAYYPPRIILNSYLAHRDIKPANSKSTYRPRTICIVTLTL